MAEYSVQNIEWYTILSVSGDLARGDMDQFIRTMDDAAAPRPVELLIVDLSELTCIGSSGMRALSVASKNLEDQGQRLVVIGVHGEIQETFSISRVDTLLTIMPDVQTARFVHSAPRRGLRLAHSG